MCVLQSVEVASVALEGVDDMAPWSIALVVDWAPLEVGARLAVVFWAPLEVGAHLVVAAAPLEVAAAASLEVVVAACIRAELSVEF